jgi:hypothetical protein
MVLDAVDVFGAEVRRLVEGDGATVALGNIVEGGRPDVAVRIELGVEAARKRQGARRCGQTGKAPGQRRGCVNVCVVREAAWRFDGTRADPGQGTPRSN